MPESVALVLLSFAWLALAMMLRQHHRLHAAMMGLLCVFDVLFPLYLYLTHNWYERLIVHKELLSFAIWAHLIFIISLYALYVLQMLSGRNMLNNKEAEQQTHQMQARAFIVVRVFVFASGLLLLEPEATANVFGG